MLQKFTRRDRALFHHRQLPDEIRQYLNGRGIPDFIIDRELLGWNGSRITIPVFGRDGEVLLFRFAKSPADTSDSPKMLSEPGSGVELYGWETLARKPYRVVVCEGEFDRLVLEANGILAVTSTAGANVFLPDWAPYFEPVRRIYICFDRDKAGARGAETVKTVLPRAKIITPPAEVGEKGDVTDYFVGLGRDRADFEILLASAAAETDDDEDNDDAEPDDTPKDHPPAVHKAVARRAERLKKSLPLDRVVRRYVDLKPSGNRLRGRCPFHQDDDPSFTVYPETDTYFCFGCGAHGDVIKFLMDKESKTYGQALEALERFLHTDELFPNAA
jgi:hypothetical protein